jgi:hypothetical protein
MASDTTPPDLNGLTLDHFVSNNVTVKFIVPYETNWGEMLVLTGSRGLFGAGNVDRGLKMSCVKGPNGLLWETTVVLPDRYKCDYRYVVYNEHSGQVLLEESVSHQLDLPKSLAGSCLLLSDTFQV